MANTFYRARFEGVQSSSVTAATCVAAHLNSCAAWTSDGTAEPCSAAGSCMYTLETNLTYNCEACPSGKEHFWSYLDSSQHNLEAIGYPLEADSAVRRLHETCRRCKAGQHDSDMNPGTAVREWPSIFTLPAAALRHPEMALITSDCGAAPACRCNLNLKR